MKLETRNQKFKEKGREHLILNAPLLIWICLIFLLSSGQGSSTQTSRIIGPILEFLFPAASPETLSFYHGIIRKFAHFAEYAVLGLLACRAFAGSPLQFLREHFYWAAIAVVLSVAVLDEVNQSFNPARTGSPIDTMIDLCGGVTATLLYYFLTKRGRRPVSQDA